MTLSLLLKAVITWTLRAALSCQWELSCFAPHAFLCPHGCYFCGPPRVAMVPGFLAAGDCQIVRVPSLPYLTHSGVEDCFGKAFVGGFILGGPSDKDVALCLSFCPHPEVWPHFSLQLLAFGASCHTLALSQTCFFTTTSRPPLRPSHGKHNPTEFFW